MKRVRFVLLPLLLMPIIVLFSITGCATNGTAPAATTSSTGGLQDGLSQQQLMQILEESLADYASINTYKFDMDMNIFADVSGGPESGSISMITKSSGATNIASKQMQMNMEMSMSMEGMGEQGGSQTLIYDIYVISDMLYMRMEVPGMGEQWMKMPASDDLMQTFNVDVVEQQIGPLGSAVEIDLLGYENVDGSECYILSVTPDMAEFLDWVGGQQGADADIDWEELAMISDVFKKFKYVCYITKDSNTLKKIVSEIEMEFTPEQAGVSAGDFDTMIMNMYLDMRIYDQNQPFSITLPDEAEDAMEVSEDMFQ
ncbi:MAG: hypothetical protein A2Y89_04570 [Chloroflexi bacterium RBG_13_51_18]|nr:MAG: hypothetical protein A2Y89_04570 [Chloroflexi bacterium RBG_13_51_18]